MPVQISSQDTSLSFAYVVNTIQDKYVSNEVGTDKPDQPLGEIAVRIVANTALAIASTIELVAKMALAALSLITYPFSEYPFNAAIASMSLARRSGIEAIKGVFGFATPAQKDTEEGVTENPPNKTSQSSKPEDTTSQSSEADETPQTHVGWKVAGAIILLGSLAVVGYIAYQHFSETPLSTCVINSGNPKELKGAFNALKCYKKVDLNFSNMENFNSTTIKEIFNSLIKHNDCSKKANTILSTAQATITKECFGSEEPNPWGPLWLARYTRSPHLPHEYLLSLFHRNVK